MTKLLNCIVITFAMCCLPLYALDFDKATGQDVVNENGLKESGYSSAQLDMIKEKLSGKILTFNNGKVMSVSKDWKGKLQVMMTFEADKSKGFFASWFTVAAKVTDPDIAKWAADIDEGTVIKSVTGKVDKSGMFFTITDAVLTK